MRKIVFTVLAAVLGLAGTAHAQFSTGTGVVGGSLSHSKQSIMFTGPYGYNMRYTERNTTVSPRIGTFLADNFELGLQFAYRHTSHNNKSTNDESSHDLLVLTPYGRQYFSLNEWAGFYMQGGLGLGWGRSGGEDLTSSDARTRLFVASLAPGVTIRIGEHVGIDLQANLVEYTSQTYGNKSDYANTKSDPEENFKIGPDFSSVSLGISFFL